MCLSYFIINCVITCYVNVSCVFEAVLEELPLDTKHELSLVLS